MSLQLSEQPAAAILTAQDLLAGGNITHEVEVPATVLRTGTADSEDADAGLGCVRLRPLSVGTLALISRAAREDASLVPLLMIKEAMIEPKVGLDQVRQMHIGLVHFLIGRINLLSGLTLEGQAIEESAQSALGQTHLLLARHFGWTPDQVAQLTPAQVAVYLAGVEKLLAFEARRPTSSPP